MSVGRFLQQGAAGNPEQAQEETNNSDDNVIDVEEE